MKLEGITKVGGGAYLSRYDLRYRTPSGGEKIYEMFSRDGGIDGEERLRSPRVDAVMIIMTDRAHERLLLCLARLDLAAHEFPHKPARLVCRSLAYHESVALPYERRYYFCHVIAPPLAR